MVLIIALFPGSSKHLQHFTIFQIVLVRIIEFLSTVNLYRGRLQVGMQVPSHGGRVQMRGVEEVLIRQNSRGHPQTQPDVITDLRPCKKTNLSIRKGVKTCYLCVNSSALQVGVLRASGYHHIINYYLLIYQVGFIKHILKARDTACIFHRVWKSVHLVNNSITDKYCRSVVVAGFLVRLRQGYILCKILW